MGRRCVASGAGIVFVIGPECAEEEKTGRGLLIVV